MYSYTLPGAMNSCLCLTLTSPKCCGSKKPSTRQEELKTLGGGGRWWNMSEASWACRWKLKRLNVGDVPCQPESLARLTIKRRHNLF